MFGVDATEQPYENENAAIFALATLSWPIMFFVAWKYTKDTNYMDETDVVVPIHVRKELGLDADGASAKVLSHEQAAGEGGGIESEKGEGLA